MPTVDVPTLIRAIRDEFEKGLTEKRGWSRARLLDLFDRAVLKVVAQFVPPGEWK